MSVTDLYLIIVGMAVGFINTIAGGGSTLMYPFLIFLGFPIHTAIGTSRVSFVAQGVFSVAGFKSKGVFLYPFNLYVAIASMFGGIIGAWISLQVSETNLKKVLAIVMVIIAIIIIFQSKIKYKEVSTKLYGKHLWISSFIFFVIGLYGGFIQAGTGFLVIISLMLYNKLSITQANSIKGLVVLVFTIPALSLYVFYGHVNWHAGLFLAIGTSIGAWLTSRWSVNVNEKYLRYILTSIIIALAIKLWFYT